MSSSDKRRSVIHIPNGGGRSYSMGGMRSVFLADGDETANTYSIVDLSNSGPAVRLRNTRTRSCVRHVSHRSC